MSSLVKTVLVAATLALTPYVGGASSVTPTAVAAAEPATASPWAVIVLGLAVMVLGAVRRR